VQRPINGVVQFADHLGADLKAPQLLASPKDNNWETAGGNMAGTIIDVALLSKATGAALNEAGLAGEDAIVSPMVSRGISSGLMGLEMTAMQPVPEGTNYWAAKEKSLGQNVSSFLIMNAVSAPLQKSLGDGVFSTVFSNTVAGAAGGVANVGISDLVDWKKPTMDQLGTVATWTELGAVMGGIQAATPYISDAASRVFRGSGSGDDAADGATTNGATLDKSLKSSDNPNGADDGDEGSDANAGSGKKSAWQRILKMAVRRALMPKPGGAGSGAPKPPPAESADAASAAHKHKLGLPNLELVEAKK
jgi:hypothetical protein